MSLLTVRLNVLADSEAHLLTGRLHPASLLGPQTFWLRCSATIYSELPEACSSCKRSFRSLLGQVSSMKCV